MHDEGAHVPAEQQLVDFSPADVGAASKASVLTVCGPAGVGKSTFARETIRVRGLTAHTFGTADYCDVNKLKRTIRALRASHGSGILMQLGHVSGIGVIFDELERGGAITRAVMRLVVEFAASAGPNRVVVYVVRRVVDITGLRRISRSGVLVELSPPTDVQLAHLSRIIVGSPKGDDMWRVLPNEDRLTMSSSIAALARLANSNSRVVQGEGRRDIVITCSDTTIPKLAGDIIYQVLNGNMGSARRMAAVAPRAIANCHAGSVAQILRHPEDRILFARSLLASVEHGASVFGIRRDATASSYVEWLGPLAAPLIKSSASSAYGRHSNKKYKKMVAFSLPANIMIQQNVKNRKRT